MHFFVMLVVVMTLVGFLQRRDERKLQTGYLAFLLLCPALLIQAVSFLDRGGHLPFTPYPYVMSAYFLLPFLLLYFVRGVGFSRASIYSTIILVAAFFGGIVMMFFYRTFLE